MTKELSQQEIWRRVRVYVERSDLAKWRELGELLGPENAARLAHATEAHAFVKKIVESLRQ